MANKTSKRNGSEKHRPAEEPSGDKFLVVGVDASAGGIQALKKFFSQIPKDSGMAYVVILHMSPEHESKLAEILQTTSPIPVNQVTERVKIEPNRAYVIPPNRNLGMTDGHLSLSEMGGQQGRRSPIDTFFGTLAENNQERGVSVVLSGTGADGAIGLKRVKEYGGVAFAQDLEILGHPATKVVVDGLRPMGPSRLGGHRQEVHKPIAFNGLLTNKILTALPGPDFAHMLSYLEPVSLYAGQEIYIFGESIDSIYFPETAVISHLYFLEDGSTTGAAIVGNEGIVGLSAVLDSRPASYWTQVTVGGTAVRVQPRVIREEFARGGAMQRLLLSYLRVRLAHLSQRAACSGRHTLRERLCTWLLMVHDRVGDEEILLTHENIAHHLGARRAGVSTTCNALRDRGIIKYRRGRLRISDRALLEQVACECYRALRQFD